jgi:ABC-type uncharacterized transport system permease subunit
MKHSHYLKAWLFFFLVATVGGMFAGMLLGAFLGAVLAIAHVDLPTIKIVCGVAGFLISIPLSYFTFFWVVSRFIVNPLLLPPSVGPASQAAPPAPPAIAPLSGASGAGPIERSTQGESP